MLVIVKISVAAKCESGEHFSYGLPDFILYFLVFILHHKSCRGIFFFVTDLTFLLRRD